MGRSVVPSIASTGYHAEPLVPLSDDGYVDFAFFPIWPALVRVASLGILPVELVAVVLANVLIVAAMVPIYRWFTTLLDNAGGSTRTGPVRLRAGSVRLLDGVLGVALRPPRRVGDVFGPAPRRSASRRVRGAMSAPYRLGDWRGGGRARCAVSSTGTGDGRRGLPWLLVL